VGTFARAQQRIPRNPRILALGLAIFVVGGVVFWLPLGTTPISNASISGGNWTEIRIPASATFDGEAVRLVVEWQAQHDCTPGLRCPDFLPFNLALVDCGASGCPNLSSYPAQGANYSPLVSGGTSFLALPGHTYGLLMQSQSPVGFPYMMDFELSYWGPIAGGWAGLALAGMGIIPVGFWLGQAPPPKQPDRPF
jgi:hypothetical protein